MKNNNKIYPFIMSGGSGKRLWPLSRSLYPKQFVQIGRELSYYQNTLKRLDKKIFHDPSIICNINHRFMVKDQANFIGQKLLNIYLEPVGKNTASAAIISAVSCHEDDLILLMPSDHIISNKKKFNEVVKKSIPMAIEGKIILFGINPDRPDPSLGYICTKKYKDKFCYSIKKFIEKPSYKKSEYLFKLRSTFWNSGIFLFKASTFISEVKKYCNNNYKYTLKAFENKKYDGDFYFIDKNYFSRNKDISIDYAVIQNSNNLLMSELNTKWSDMGSWESYWLNNIKNQDKNVISGNNFSNASKNSLIYSDKQLTVTIGIENLIVASFSDSLLVMDRKYSNHLANVIEKMKHKKFAELTNSSKCYRPWGSYESLKNEKGFQVKEIIINPKSAISLQKHKKRSEHWVVIEGIATITKGKKGFST